MATPFLFSGFLVGKWQGAVTQVLAVAASVVIYYPFVKALDRQYQKKKPMKYQKHCRERGVKEMHVENDENICCEVEKEWKNVSSDGARVGSNLFLLFSNLRRIYGSEYR